VTTIAKLAVQLVADTSGYSKGLLDAQNKTSAFSKGVLGNLNTVGSGILGGTLAVLKGAVVATTAIAAAGAIAATKFLYDSVQAAAEAQKVQAQLNAVLESTGGIAGITAEEVNALADSLSRGHTVRG
jgi:phage-related minor tail protein